MDRRQIEQRITSEQLHREAPIRVVPRAKGEPEDAPRRYEVAISSEAEVERWFGIEILDHSRSAIDMTRAKRGLAVLVDHRGDQIGVVRNIRIDNDRVLRGDVQFSASVRGQEVERDVRDGIRESVSVGYFIREVKLVEQRKGGVDVYRVQRWQPAEVSFVSVPADVSVGVGRSSDAGRQHSVGAVVDEQQRVREIEEMCRTHNMEARAADFIASTLTADEVGKRILASKARQTAAQPAAEMIEELSPRHRKGYSFVRLINGALAEREGTGKLDGLEAEVHAECARKTKGVIPHRGGFFAPMDLRTDAERMEQRALDTKTLTKGSELVNDQPGEFIELLRNRSAVVTSGARVLPGLVGNVAFPKQTGPTTAYWVGENPGMDVTESEVGLATAIMAPKTLQATTSYSRQLLAQSSFDVEEMVRNDFAAVHALALDRAALHGLGVSGEPLGVMLAGGVNEKDFSSAVPGFSGLLDMVGAIADKNADMGSLGWITTPLMAAKLSATLIASSAGSDMIWSGPFNDGRMTGYKAMASGQVSKTMTSAYATTGGSFHGVVFGNWADMLLGLWGVLEVIVDPYSKKKQGLIEVATFEMADVLLRHPESFAKAKQATIS